MIKISKEVTFDCAHMLSGHQGLCANLHGHTYKLQIAIIGHPIKTDGDPSEGMLMDFKDLKALIQEIVLEDFDHAVIFSGKEYRNAAEEDLYQVVVSNGLRHVVLAGRSTAEYMAAYFERTFLKALRDKDLWNIICVNVKLWETPTSYAEA